MIYNVRHTTTAVEMWSKICNVHQKHDLLNKFSSQRDLYTSIFRTGEKFHVNINRVRHMASILESMYVQIDDKEMSMAVLNGLPQLHSTLIPALDAIGDEDASFTFDKLRIRLLKEESRTILQGEGIYSTSKASALFNQSSVGTTRGAANKSFTYCGRTNQNEQNC